MSELDVAAAERSEGLQIVFASTPAEVDLALAIRHRVFVEELGEHRLICMSKSLD